MAHGPGDDSHLRLTLLTAAAILAVLDAAVGEGPLDANLIRRVREEGNPNEGM